MINEYENLLRRLIITILGENDEVDYKVSPDRIDKWKKKRDIELKKYRGTLSEKRILFYSDFYDLEVIILKNWELFIGVFYDKKKFSALFSIMDTFRNTLAHGRSLFTYQEKLIEGITGELQSSIIKFHNQNMSIDDYFIKIMKISDVIGHTWEVGTGSSLAMLTEYTLRVGDKVEIRIDAYDPKGREIEYELSHDIGSKSKTKIINNDGVFLLEITKDMISPNAPFQISVRTEEEDYKNEKSLTIFYTVLP
jgi:hypothetical protein